MTDESIIDLYFARDSMAIHYSQERYGNLCHAVASNILPTLEDAQECVNDTWLKAWNSIPPTRPKRLGAYLSRITRNLSLERWRTIHAQKMNTLHANKEVLNIKETLAKAQSLKGPDGMGAENEFHPNPCRRNCDDLSDLQVIQQSRAT